MHLTYDAEVAATDIPPQASPSAGTPKGAKAAHVVLVVLTVFVAATVRADPPLPPPGERPVAADLDAGASDLDAEARDLERQKARIEQRLAQINARRRGATTEPAASTRPGADGPAVAGRNAPANAEPSARPGEAPAESIPAKSAVEQFSVHGQATTITQKHEAFRSPYAGPNSLPSHEGAKTSITATLFLGMRLPWEGAAAYFDPEIAGGEGFGNVTGLAGFPNGEIPRVGAPAPQPYVARLYYQQIFNLGGESKAIEADQNQLAGFLPERRIALTLGRFSATDFFDGNAYSHDPRTQFMNWDLMDQGAWDYPADTRGYTEGGVIEYDEPKWALRYGFFAGPSNANGGSFDSHVSRRLGHALELEERYTLGGHPGEFRVMGFLNAAHMGNYRQAIDRAGDGGTPDVTQTRGDRIKYGFNLEVEQEIVRDLGIFGRLGWNDGHTESWTFTEIDRSASLGLSLKGTHWSRPDDTVGLAAAVNGLSKDHRDYLAAGGLGFILGDGRLPHYGLEQTLETYYLFKISDHVFVTANLQFINNPAYNRDRGPIYLGGLRAHFAF